MSTSLIFVKEKTTKYCTFLTSELQSSFFVVVVWIQAYTFKPWMHFLGTLKLFFKILQFLTLFLYGQGIIIKRKMRNPILSSIYNCLY